MKLRFLTVILFALASSRALGQVEAIYDLERRFSNPLRELPENCIACVDFYRVNRLVAPFVYHIFVGASVEWTCEASEAPSSTAMPSANDSQNSDSRNRQSLAPQTNNSEHVYGGTKGESDLSRFRKYLADPVRHQSRLRHAGRACGEKAVAALDAAVEVSIRRQVWFRENPILATGRFVATPIMGRPCAVGAAEVLNAAKPFFTEPNDSVE